MCNNVGLVSDWFGADQMEDFRKELCVGDLLEFKRGILFNHWAVCVYNVDGKDGPVVVHLLADEASAWLPSVSGSASGTVAHASLLNTLLQSASGRYVGSKASASGIIGPSLVASIAASALLETEIGKLVVKKAMKAVGIDSKKVSMELLSVVLGESKVRINNRMDACRQPRHADEIFEVANEAYKRDEAGGDYSLFQNNCEHFANYCRYGVSQSIQVDKVVLSGLTVAAGGILGGPVTVALMLSGCAYVLFSAIETSSSSTSSEKGSDNKKTG